MKNWRMKRRVSPLFLVFIISLLAAVFVWWFYLRLNNLNWDEAFHLYWTYLICDSLRVGDLARFWNTTLQETFYPPFESWFLAIPSLLFGFSIEKARIYSLFWLILMGMLVFYLGRKISRSLGLSANESILAGYGALFFLLTSPLVLFQSSMAVKEMMGAGLFLLIILTYFSAREKRNPFLFFLVSLELFVAIMTKYNYGVLIAGILGLEGGITFLFNKRKIETILSHLLIFLPFVLLTAAWIFLPHNILQRFLEVITNRVPVTSGMTDFWGFLLFYPRAIVYMYSFSPIVGIFLLLSIIVSLLFWKNFRVRVLVLGVIVDLCLATYSTWNVQERYIFPVMPFLFILGGVILAKLVFGMKRFIGIKSFPWARLVLFVFLVAFCARDFLRLPNYVYSVGAYTARSPVFNQTDYKDLFFEYDTSKWSKKLPRGSFEKPEDVLEWVVGRVDLSKPVEVVGQAAELAPDYFNLVFAMHKNSGDYPRIEGYFSFVVTLEVLPSSKFNSWDFKTFNSYRLVHVRGIENDTSLTLLQKKKFKELDVEVRIYGRK